MGAEFLVSGSLFESKPKTGSLLLRTAEHLGFEMSITSVCECVYKEEVPFKIREELLHWLLSVGFKMSTTAAAQVGRSLIDGNGVEKNFEKG